MNFVFLMGRTFKDVELNASGKVATSGIAVDRILKDANGNKVTDFINLKWLGEKKAKFASDYIPKGTKISIRGSLCIDQYEKDGQKRQAVYVNVDETEFCESKSSQSSNPKPATVKPDADGFVSTYGDDEELLFN